MQRAVPPADCRARSKLVGVDPSGRLASRGRSGNRIPPLATSRIRSRVTSFDVAALAGVSQSAVSRAFNPGASLSETKRARIVEAARKLNYVPHSIASSLTTKRTTIVAMIVGSLKNPFYVEALQLFSRKLQNQGRQILVFTAGEGMCTDAIIMRVLRYQVDGIIITSANLSTRMTGLSQERGIPVVLFNRNVPGAEAACIRCDNAHGGDVLADALLAAGARRFAMITGDQGATTSQDRVRGLLDTLAESGVRASTVEQAPGHSTYEGARRRPPRSSVAAGAGRGRMGSIAATTSWRWARSTISGSKSGCACPKI